MNNGQKSLSINETFIIESENDGTMSACTGFFTNALVSCTGNTQILLGTNIIQANSAFSATTFYGDGSNLTGISTQDTFVTGGTYSEGTTIFTNNTGGTFNVTGFYTGTTDVFTTGGTYSDGNAIFTNNTGGTFNVSGFSTGVGSNPGIENWYVNYGSTGVLYFDTNVRTYGSTQLSNDDSTWTNNTKETLSFNVAASVFWIGSGNADEIINTLYIQHSSLGTVQSSSVATNLTYGLSDVYATAVSADIILEPNESFYIGSFSRLDGNNVTTNFIDGRLDIASLFVGEQGPQGIAGGPVISSGTTLYSNNPATSNFSTNNSIFLGNQAGENATNASNSIFLGNQAGENATNASNSIFLGMRAGVGATNASNSNFFNSGAGIGATNASNSNFFGNGAGIDAANANNSNFLGTSAGAGATGASNSNLFGFAAGKTFTGNTIGTNNIIIGTNISSPNAATNRINIGGVLFGTGAYSATTGNPSITGQTNGRIGVCVVNPTKRLHISGETANDSGLRLETLTSASPASTGQAIGVDLSGNVVTIINEDNLPLISKSTYLLIPNIDNAVTTVIGKAINITGTNSAKTWSSSSYLTRQLRIGYLSIATPGTFNSLRQIIGYFSIGQGFKYLTGFGGSTGFDLTQSRAYIGVTFSNNTTGNVEQDTMINSFGVGRLSTSDNWWIMHNDASGIATKVDTGFLANTVNTLSYYLSMETVGSNVKFIVTQINASGAVANTFTYTATNDLPALDFPLTQRVFVTNNTNSSIVTLDWFGSKLITN
jgi:hypothetical protein